MILSECTIFSAAALKSSNPTRRMINETIKDEIYSNLPCPKGCSRSGFLLLNFAPIMEISDEPVSDKLFNASETIAILPIKSPIEIFKANRNRLHITPKIPPRTLYCSRTCVSFVLSLSFTKCLMRNFIKENNSFI